MQKEVNKMDQHWQTVANLWSEIVGEETLQTGDWTGMREAKLERAFTDEEI